MTSPAAGAWLEKADGACVPLAGNCSLGRSSSSGVPIADTRVSRNHATIHAQTGDEFWLIDLGSANGTFLNGRRVVRPTRLQDGDVVKIAETELLFRRKASSAAERSASLSLATVSVVRSEPHWLLLADIEKFTEVSQRLAPEALATLVGSWLRAGRTIVEDHGGAVDKYLGDGFLACWRAEGERAPRLARVIKAFVSLREKGEPKFRVVVHHASVSVGGVESFGGESLMGPEVNFVFRAEEVARSAGAAFCFTESAHALLAEHLPLTPIDGARKLKGFDASFRFFHLETAASLECHAGDRVDSR